MPESSSLRRFVAPLMLACVAVAGCGSIDSMSRGMANSLSPYQVEVVQGNFVSREQVEALRPGMARLQVLEVLGTPLLSSVFHADRWDYVFTLKRKGQPFQARHLTVHFKGDLLERFEGDDMPSEAEFIAQFDAQRRTGKVPVLEATEAQLKAFAPATPASAARADSAAPPLPARYPPLEAPAR